MVLKPESCFVCLGAAQTGVCSDIAAEERAEIVADLGDLLACEGEESQRDIHDALDQSGEE